MRLVLCALALALSGCGGCRSSGGAVDAGPDAAWLEGRLPPGSAGRPSEGGALVVRLPVEPRGLSRIFDDQAEGTMVRLTQATVYETLARPVGDGSSGALEPVLARAWEERGDHLAVSVHLRPGVRFHDGSTLDAEDLRAVLALILAPDSGCATLRASLGPVDHVAVLDPLTVEVWWRSPDVYALDTLLAAVPLMPSEALVGELTASPLHRHPVGTGPFRFQAWKPGESLSFSRFEGWWGGRPPLDRVEFRFVRDDGQAMERWRRGEFDLVTRIPPEHWRALEGREPAHAWAWRGYHRLRWFDANQGWIGWNERHPPLDDVAVRRALALAWPAAAVAKVAELGLERRITCPWAPGSAGCDPSLQPPDLDLAGARRLLDEAGWRDSDGDGTRDREGRPLRFTFLAAAGSARQARALPLYQEQLATLGVRMEVETVDPATTVARMRSRDFDAVMMSWSSLDAMVDASLVLHSSQAELGGNVVGYRNATVDALLDRARATFDPAARHALEQEVHRLTFDEQPYLFLTTRPNLDAVSVHLHDLAFAGGWYDLAHAWKER